MTPFSFQSIGIVHSPFKEKFGIPRQPGLAPSSKAVLELLPPFNVPDAVNGLDQFSHIWVVFVFHETAQRGWTPTVRPPRLGGNERMGVFATRSTHRPNPIGLSVVELDRIEVNGEKVLLHLKNIDLLDGTPVLDIKPYIPYSDALPQANAGFAASAPERIMTVSFDSAIAEQLADLPDLKQLIIDVLSFDPRPAYKVEKSEDRVYGMAIGDKDVKFIIDKNKLRVIGL
ncbi:tRNA (N6-threonylcarbamoyladenosine(37)-N6)-methyltransferase TrmO [Solitalea sp. MAHUQ-68]|uniref:tRNA (N6-threonylcarbamoyladenosine(37)-N6)-methyltransferase TrmO n=1 Tax=Solitalea agri TaxID=2953739 RepID=A0A9X2F2D1_9SPHI|nr:tRNA (N6-threonylcarbamoyladenosine(37)-N6)-methyltransferase TrmO [Solitalea agri]MCO4292834.1 tRNA (N6-threonylcarbamoyladenosine(37)-N6)-methyltransferase TrmO [Solitalea agri]